MTTVTVYNTQHGKRGFVTTATVAEYLRVETSQSLPSAKIWQPTLADIQQHYPEEMGYELEIWRY